ncbi:MAG: nitrous oxide reductase family maturation protein NosD [Gammaproteobacteria bacterium]|nr:nitrous oxide reductase family maturation protein NosD [Gammaproteobacteria bacterium]MCW9005182.1 nitrous oxide reductase family maturation protein NosD [Gammaproteobacteria bacterium]
MHIVRKHIKIILYVLLISFATQSQAADKKSLQQLIDAAKAGDVITLDEGVYKGRLVIEKAITLDGQNKAIIDAEGKGSVIYLDTDGAVIKNLRLVNSGESHNDIDSGVQVRGNFNVIKDNVIEDCLFGIDLQQSENNIVRRNEISSKPVDLGLRGDAIRLWYSFGNKITYNYIHDSRDTVVWYSKNNLIAHNRSTRGRYALHFMYAQYNKIEENKYWNNSVGIFLMYSDGVEIRNNEVTHANGATGVGIGMKESSEIIVKGNKLLYNAVGFYMDVSPFQPDTINQVEENLVAFNNIGVRFLNDWPGNHFINNRFKSNINQVSVSDGDTANRNKWDGNYWDDYQGFDLNKDGIGDTPYEYYSYADRIWMDVPGAEFFKGSPVLEVLDFLERLAPFSPPELVMRDSRPKRLVE